MPDIFSSEVLLLVSQNQPGKTSRRVCEIAFMRCFLFKSSHSIERGQCAREGQIQGGFASVRHNSSRSHSRASFYIHSLAHSFISACCRERALRLFAPTSLNLLRKLRQRFPEPRDFIRHLREQLARLQQIAIPRALR